MCLCKDQQDGHFRELALMIQRAATLAQKQTIEKPTSCTVKSLNPRASQLLKKYFPLDRQHTVSSHHIKCFTFKGNNDDWEIRTQVRSETVTFPSFENIVTVMSPTDHMDSNQAISLRWYHAAANHSGWVEYMMDHMLGSQSAFISRKTFRKFWTQNIRSTGNLRFGSWSSKPSCDFLGPEEIRSSAGSSKSQGLLLLMPFLHWDTIEHLTGREEAIEIFRSDGLPQALRSDYESAVADTDTRFTSASIIANPPLHLPLLLDQYKYPTASLPTTRLVKQILPRATESSVTGRKTLTVQQLWLIVPNNGNPLSPSPTPSVTHANISNRHCCHVFSPKGA